MEVQQNAPCNNDTKEVLVVDDSRTHRALVIAALSDYKNFKFVEALDGLDALHKIHKLIRLVILDYNMPQMNGLEFLRQIKGYEEFKHIPIIMLTADNDEKIIKDCYAAGANIYVTKPLQPKELVKAVEVVRHWYMKET